MNCRRGLILLVFILFISFSNQSFAQDCCPPDPVTGDIDPNCNPDLPPCPIDGGLSLLIVAGIGLGARRAYKLKKTGTVCNL